MASSADEKKVGAVLKRPPMRSSIACLRCRKSKIKCDNFGGSSPCDGCVKTGKECRYPDPTFLPPKRLDPPMTVKREGEAAQSERKRLKRLDESPITTTSSASRFGAEILAAPYLTETLWIQCFDIFKLHFATELPFLHVPTLKWYCGSPKNRGSDRPGDSDVNLVLLGMLTLTARFHPDLVKYIAHSVANQQGGSAKNRSIQIRSDGSTATAASEYFADILAKSLGPMRSCMAVASVERVQAFLMLGLYEWSQAKPSTGGLGAWMYVGIAIRMAQALGLCFGDRIQEAKPTLVPVQAEPQHHGGKRKRMAESDAPIAELVTAKEVRRRTMWSCFILDRMLSCGKERVSAIRSGDMKIQLPCSEMDFDFAEESLTGFLTTTDAERASKGYRDNLLGCFIKLVGIWGEISEYSFAGGRAVDGESPPWMESTTFAHLDRRLDEFYAALPPVLKLSRANYLKHENHQGSSSYVSLHMLGCICQIMLHREYIPFIPIRCSGPVGPLDAKTFPEGHYQVPEDFWLRSTEKVFRSAREIVDLIETCQSRDKLPMSGLVLFAVWTAAFVGIYAYHFPHMDTEDHMLADEDTDDNELGGGPDDSSGGTGEGGGGTVTPAGDGGGITKSGPSSVTFHTLAKMYSSLKMAGTYNMYFLEMDRYYQQTKSDYQAAVQGGGGEAGARVAPVGGGLKEWQEESSKVVNNGVIMAVEDKSLAAVSYDDRDSPNTTGGPEVYDDNGPGAGRQQSQQQPPQRPASSLSFTPINSASAPIGSGAAHGGGGIGFTSTNRLGTPGDDAAGPATGAGAWSRQQQQAALALQHHHHRQQAQAQAHPQSPMQISNYLEANENKRWEDSSPGIGHFSGRDTNDEWTSTGQPPVYGLSSPGP
ncbi:hypothetical protein RB601_002710 [Gaeumannomyces tritici]